MSGDPWERIRELADQIEKWSAARLGLSVIKSMAEEIVMQTEIIKEEK